MIPALIAPQSLEEEINIKHKINTQLQIVVWAIQEKGEGCVCHSKWCASPVFERRYLIVINTIEFNSMKPTINCDENFHLLHNNINIAKFNQDLKILIIICARNHEEDKRIAPIKVSEKGLSRFRLEKRKQ